MKKEITFGPGWEKGLGDFYRKYYQSTLEDLGFDQFKQQEGPGMGASLILIGHGIIVRIINDRDQYFVSIGKEDEIIQWWDIEFIMSYFKIIDDNISKSNTGRREVILWVTYNWENYSDNANYFSNNFDRIKALFQDDKVENSIQDLNNLKEELMEYRRRRINNAC
jgi:hypothetical protein